jgi:hypothetical protein
MEKQETWIFEPGLSQRDQLEKRYLNRMGCGKKANMSPRILDPARSVLNISLEIAKPRAIVQLAEVLTITETTIQGEGISIESPLWAGLASRSAPPLTLAVFAMTLGQALSDEVVHAKKSSLLLGYCLHEAGSQIIEQAADEMERLIQDIPAVKERARSRRFSPGYCDISLYNQKGFFQFLSPEKIGIRMSGSCGMVPEKSITAALLFSENLPSISPCPDCQNEACPNRRGKRVHSNK